MKFDVFVSFRGTDTGRTFVSHLCHMLDRRRLTTFKHEEDTWGNQPASSEVLQAIEESTMAVAIISENYASSVWCLDELEKIIECNVKGSLAVMPVFYEVDYPDVVRKSEELANDLNGERDNINMEKVNRWSDALKSLTRFPSHNSSQWLEDSKLIENIIENVFRHWFAAQPALGNTTSGHSSMLHGTDVLSTTDLVSMTIQDARDSLGTLAGRYMFGEKPITVEPRPGSSVYGEEYITGNDLARLVPSMSSDFKTLGMDRHMKAIYTLLDLELSDGVREIGIWGAGGVGKTTLARFVYEEISPNFQDHYYYHHESRVDASSNFRSRSSTSLLEKITRDVITENNLDMIQNVVKAKLGHRKVLLIVDGLEFQNHLQRITTIARLFGRGSRLIVVHKNRDLIGSGVGHLYEVESMKFDEALEFFSLFAFKQEHVPRGFYRLSARAVFIAGHVPLAMKVLGSFLHGKDVNEWEYELCKLEASQNNWNIAVVSSYIAGDFYQRRSSTNLDRCIGVESDGDDFPSYFFALG